MIRFLKITLFAALLIVLVPCQAQAATKQQQPTRYINSTAYTQHAAIQVRLNVPRFSAIDANGDFQIIVSNGKQQSVTLIGHPSAIGRVTARVADRSLMLRMAVSRSESYTYNPRVTVKIVTPTPLSLIVLAGKTTLRATGVRTSSLSIFTYDSASVYLPGTVNVQRIQNNSSGDIQIGWVNARGLVINGAGYGGWVRMKGSVAILTAHLRNAACLEAEHLRANKVYVETAGYSIARVQPVSALYAYAADYSNIYYFREPPLVSGSTRNSGNVLKVANW